MTLRCHIVKCRFKQRGSAQVVAHFVDEGVHRLTGLGIDVLDGAAGRQALQDLALVFDDGLQEDGAWSCKSCLIIHRPDVAGMVMDALMRGEALEAVWKRLEEKL